MSWGAFRRFGWRAGCFAALLASLSLSGEEVEKPAGEEAEKKEKPKEAPFKYSAWCAFRDFARVEVVEKNPPKPDKDPLKNTQSRPGSGQWSGFARHGKWLTLVVELQNTTEDDPMNGSMRIRLDPSQESDQGQKPYTTRYRQDYDLPPMTTKRFTFSLLAPEFQFNEIVVDIVADGRSYQRNVTLMDLDQDPKRPQELVVVVSEQAGAFKFLTSRPTNTDPMVEDRTTYRQVAVVRPDDLPERWHDLVMANLIIIDDPPREGFSDEQLEALETYVQAGGCLLIGAGKDPQLLNARAEQTRSLADLAGVRVNGSGEIAQIDVGRDSRQKEGIAFRAGGDDWRLPIVDISVAPGLENDVVASLNSGKEGYIERTDRSLGLGRVWLLTFSISDPQLQGWAGRQQLPMELLSKYKRQELFAYEDPNLREEVNFNPWFGEEQQDIQPDRGSLFKLRKDVDTSYTRDTPVETQKAHFVASFLLLYLLFAVPGNYLIFGWFKRREIAWLAVPVWALVFSVAAYFYGYYGRVGNLTINQACFIEAGPGQPVGVARTFMGIYAPRRGEYDLDFGDESMPPEDVRAAPGHLIRDLRTRGLETVLPELYLVEQDGAMAVKDLLIQSRATRRLEINHRVPLGGGILVSMTGEKGKKELTVSVQNLMQREYQLLNAAIVEQSMKGLRGLRLGHLPGGMGAPLIRKVSADGGEWEDVDQAFFMGPPTFRHARGPDSAERGRAMLEFVRARVARYRQAVLLGWIDGGVLPVQVDGREPGTLRGMALVIVPFKGTGARRLDFSDDYHTVPMAATWHYLGPGRRTRLHALMTQGQQAGALSFRGQISVDELRDTSAKTVQVSFQIGALTANELGPNVYRAPYHYKGNLMVEIQVRRGADGGLVYQKMVPAQVKVELDAGNRTQRLVFRYPFSPQIVEQDHVILKVSVQNLQIQGEWDQQDLEFPLTVDGLRMELTESD